MGLLHIREVAEVWLGYHTSDVMGESVGPEESEEIPFKCHFLATFWPGSCSSNMAVIPPVPRL